MQNTVQGQGIFHRPPPVDCKGLFPYYGFMPYTPAQQRDARDTLDYIDSLKHDVAALLYSKTHLMYSAIHVPEPDFKRALQCINEVLDDLFYREMNEARQVLGM